MSSQRLELTSVWGVEIEGDNDDLRNVERKINGSIVSLDSLFVSRLDDLFVLRCRLWDNAAEPEAVQLAADDLKLVRSCVDLLDTCGALEVGTVFRWEANSDRIIQTRRTVLSVRKKETEEEWATPDAFRRIFQSAQNHIHLQDALREHNWAGDWYDIYKSLEALKLHYGTERGLLQAFPGEKSAIELLKRTANSHRHTRRVFAEIANPMAIADARELLAKLLAATAANNVPTSRPANALPIGAQVIKADYGEPGGSSYGLKRLGIKPVAGPNGRLWDFRDPKCKADE